MKTFPLVAILLLSYSLLPAQPRIPKSYAKMGYDEKGQLYFIHDDKKLYADTAPPVFTLQQMIGDPQGSENGIVLDFKKPDLAGIVYYGFIPYGEPKHPLPVYRGEAKIENGKAEMNFRQHLGGVFDMIDWREKKSGTIGYRVTSGNGRLLYDGVVSFKGNGPFEVVPSINSGPFINKLEHDRVTISFGTHTKAAATLKVGGRTFSSHNTDHEITVTGLKPLTKYDYTISCMGIEQSYSFETAPLPGTRKPFVFAYTSDSRKSPGGGERDIYGTNAYMMKKIAAVAVQQGAKFMQFTGDMADGYLRHKEEELLQLTNWKKAVEPFWHYMPIYAGMGNHEAVGHIFRKGTGWVFVDKFPFDTESSEATFSRAFVNHLNGPESEDGSRYDPDPSAADFPSYKENVFFYTYDNVAMVVMNSNYWYAPSISGDSSSGGNLHGYFMDNQMKWLEETLKKLEADKNIDHIFLTQHTPTFPNGGHVGDDMWYRGNNNKRAYVAGKPVDKGIIQRRDEYLDLLINKSRKVIAILTGDEHNYNRLQLTREVEIYPADYPFKKLNVSRSIFQINNGAAGAPYYAQELAPWTPHTKAFSVQNAICLFYVDGKKIRMKVVNPDALNVIDELQLR